MRKHYREGGPAVVHYDLRTELMSARPILEGDAAFYRKWARKSGGPVLELGCGTGRISLPLARAGFKVVGLDLSAHMLRLARQKALGLRNVHFVRGDMASFDLRSRFRLVLIPFRAFQHLKEPRLQRACLQRIHRHLLPGGRLIVQLFDPKLEACLPEGHAAVMTRQGFALPGTDHRMDIQIRDRRNDPFNQTFVETWVWTERDSNGRAVRRTTDRLSLRWTYREEMRYLLELCGFEEEALYGDFKGGKPRYGAEQIWVARRR